MARFLGFKQDKSLTTIPTTYQQVAEGVTRRMPRVHGAAIVKINQLAKQIFIGKIERSRYSASLGNVPYGRNRVSGKFTFGKGLTFVGKELPRTKTVQGFGYPDERRADLKTKGVWRFLEKGAVYTNWPSRAAFFDTGGAAGFVPATAGRDDQVFPGVGQPVQFERKVIDPRFYIKNAVLTIQATYLEPAYQRILDEAIRDAGK